MILKKLFIKNMFAYYGEIEIDLEPKNNKNIILIGARNGRGKTSFLKIIRILIHGLKDNSDFTKQDANLTPNEYALGKGNKWEGIFYKKYGVETASVKGVFEFEDKELVITREFMKKTNTFDEDITVFYNEKREKDAQTFLNNILPSHFAQFFFFDGEKLEDLMNTQSINVKESLEILLNIKTYEKLMKYISSVQKEYKKETEDTPTSEEIQKLEYNQKSLITDIKIHKNNIESIEKEIKVLQIEIEEKVEKLTDLLANKKADIKPLKQEKEKIETELIELKEYIGKKVKGIDLLILMSESLSRTYLAKLEDDKTNYQLDEQLKDFKRALNGIITSIQNNIFDSEVVSIPPEYNLSSDITDFYSDRIREESDKAYKEFKNKKNKELDKQIIYYNEDDKESLQHAFEEKAIIDFLQN